MDAQVNPSPSNTPSIISVAQSCRSQLQACTLSNKLVKSQWAYDRLSDFDLWDTGVGASAEGSDSLDFRLAEDQTSRKVVIVSLNTLKAWIHICQMLAGDVTAQAMGPNAYRPAINAPSQAMDEPHVTTPDGITLEEAKSGVEDLQTLLVTLGVAVRHADATSHLDNVAPSAIKNETSLTDPNVPIPSEKPEEASWDIEHSYHESTASRSLQGQKIPVQASSTAPDIRANPVEANNIPRHRSVYSGSSSRGRVSYLFRINELRESGTRLPAQDFTGQWIPTDERDANIIVAAGATSITWLCDGLQIRILNDGNLLKRAKPYKTYSAYYCYGRGFLILRDNATTTKREEGWLPLSFDHDKTDYSSYLTNARFEPSLHCHRSDQKWLKMLLPDVYHDSREVPAPYGGLKGELAIFLALIAFSIPVEDLQTYLPAMFQSGKWQQFDMLNGRDHKRGVVVEIWTFPSRHGGSSPDQLQNYEENGMYYA